jgi:hypothetical protein
VKACQGKDFTLEIYPRVEHQECTPLGKVPALLTNIRLGCGGLQGANILAYLPKASVMKKKRFATLTPVVDFIIFFTSITYGPSKICHVHCMHVPILFFSNVHTHFAEATSYEN